MTMELQPADYILCVLTLTAAVMGLFRGFSGTLAVFAALAVGGTAATFTWAFSAEFTPEVWLRAAMTLVAALLAFGIVRLVVKKLVNGLLAQPTDAIFGMLAGAAAGALLAVGWAWSGMFLEYSTIASAVATVIR
jgi:uncharacterized membrane protein required for colicin V production